MLVAYEPTASGRVALSHALALAGGSGGGGSGGSLTVAAVARQERTDMGCAHCRANAAWWNEQMRVVARERLVELAADLSDPSTSIRYLTACGPTSKVLAQAAEQYDIDVIVLPWRRARRLRRLLRVSDAERLARPRRWEVVVAPRADRRAPFSSDNDDAQAQGELLGELAADCERAVGAA